jgi:uncharacterized protein (DUF58 family)
MTRHGWKRLKEFAADSLRLRPTRAGFGFTATVAVVAALAFVSANNLLFLALGFLVALTGISGFLSRLSLAGLELDFAFPDHVAARRSIPARMRLRNEKSWMPTFSIRVTGAAGSVYSSDLYFPIIPGGATVEEPVNVRFARRGRHKENSFLLRSRFPFGFAERQVRLTLRTEVLVYPCLDPAPAVERVWKQIRGDLETQVRGRGHDFYRIRPYEPLESARHLDWRASAHTGELQVREFARDADPSVELFFDLNADPAWFEKAVECAAFLVWEVTQSGARLRFRSHDVDIAVPLEGDVYRVLGYLALVEPRTVSGVPAPGRDDHVRVVVSTAPERFAEGAWGNARLIGPGTFE